MIFRSIYTVYSVYDHITSFPLFWFPNQQNNTRSSLWWRSHVQHIDDLDWDLVWEKTARDEANSQVDLLSYCWPVKRSVTAFLTSFPLLFAQFSRAWAKVAACGIPSNRFQSEFHATLPRSVAEVQLQVYKKIKGKPLSPSTSTLLCLLFGKKANDKSTDRPFCNSIGWFTATGRETGRIKSRNK